MGNYLTAEEKQRYMANYNIEDISRRKSYPLRAARRKSVLGPPAHKTIVLKIERETLVEIRVTEPKTMTCGWLLSEVQRAYKDHCS